MVLVCFGLDWLLGEFVLLMRYQYYMTPGKLLGDITLQLSSTKSLISSFLTSVLGKFSMRDNTKYPVRSNLFTSRYDDNHHHKFVLGSCQQ